MVLKKIVSDTSECKNLLMRLAKRELAGSRWQEGDNTQVVSLCNSLYEGTQ